MEEKMIALAGFIIISGLFVLERYRRYALEKKSTGWYRNWTVFY